MSLSLICQRDSRSPVATDPRSLACHTAILAQSGSGKSFLVGRLVEELLIRTKARVVILDPNSDYVRLPEIDEKAWTLEYLKPWFSPGDTKEAFATQWSEVKPTVLSNRYLPSVHPLLINWGGLSDREKAAVLDVDPSTQPELYWALVLVSEITRSRQDESQGLDYDFESFRNVADELCDHLLGESAAADIADNAIAASLRSAGPTLALRFRALIYGLEAFEIWKGTGDSERDIADVINAGDQQAPAAVVVDLLSVETEGERLALASRAVSAVWKAAREDFGASLRDIDEEDHRRPTFLIIDEAHNLVPSQRTSPAAERLATDVIRIAAEGRKFGLFLILITQRPRKVDPNVLSECDNLFLMRMTNDRDLEAATEIFGFLSPDLRGAARNLRTGEVFLQGRLGADATAWHVAPRRTRQGGRSIDDSFWTSPSSAVR